MTFQTLIAKAKKYINTDQVLRNQLLWMLLLRIVLYTLLVVFSYIFQDRGFDIIIVPQKLLLVLVVLVYLTTIFSAFFLLLYEGNLRRFGFIQTLLDTCFVSLLVFFSGGSDSTFTTVYFFPIVAGGLILPRKGGLIAAAAASLQYGTILFLELYEIYPAYLKDYRIFDPVNIISNINQFAVHGLIFFLAALLSALFGLRLQKAENALSDSIRKFDRLAILYKQIFDNISTGILTIDGTNTITSANNAVGTIVGSSPDSLLGKNLLLEFPGIDLSQENLRQTTDFLRKDSKEVRIGYAHMVIEPTREDPPNPGPPNKIITLRDISEIEKLERQVRQTEKLAAIGIMSASIAHDFRNPLTAISGSAQVLADEFSQGGDTSYVNYELANIILRESNRLNTTIGEFLKFSRPEIVNCSWFSLKGCLEEVLEVLQANPNFPPSLQMEYNFEETLDVWGDEKQMFTVLSHLIQNAIPFCPPGKEHIHISASDEVPEENGELISIFVADNGSGIEESEPELIFEPFYTNRVDGTGLGLAIVRQIIDEHHGSITAANEGLPNSMEGRGAQFEIRLPMPTVN